MIKFFAWKLPFLLCITIFLYFIYCGIKYEKEKQNGVAKREKINWVELSFNILKILVISAIPVFNWLAAWSLYTQSDKILEQLYTELDGEG